MRTIVIEETGVIPDGIADLESFRRWARSDDFPETGTFSYVDGDIWADVSMEQLFTHNQVKAAFTGVLVVLVQHLRTGRFVPDRMLFTNVAVNLSTEPDGLYFNWSTVQSGKLNLIEGADGGFVELEGIPDMVLEVVSRTSVRKDEVVLRDKYWQAGIPEYWLVDARGPNPSFEILQHTSEGYVAVTDTGSGMLSTVFNRSFRMLKRMDPLGNPEFIVEHSAS